MSRSCGRPDRWPALFLFAALVSACNLPAGMLAFPPSPITPFAGPASPTPFQPIAASATPAAITIWVSPDLPVPLQSAARRLSRVGQIPVSVADNPGAAQIRLEPFGQIALATWTFALAAPFPTLEDEATLQDLRSVWSGDGGPLERLLVSPETAALLSPILGEASPTSVEVLDE
ncbi:MAG: hypothetical protein ACRDG5_04710, partial [Anaerolineales bacterium]